MPNLHHQRYIPILLIERQRTASSRSPGRRSNSDRKPGRHYPGRIARLLRDPREPVPVLGSGYLCLPPGCGICSCPLIIEHISMSFLTIPSAPPPARAPHIHRRPPEDYSLHLVGTAELPPQALVCCGCAVNIGHREGDVGKRSGDEQQEDGGLGHGVGGAGMCVGDGEVYRQQWARCRCLRNESNGGLYDGFGDGRLGCLPG